MADYYDELLAEFLNQLENQAAPEVSPWPPEITDDELDLCKRVVSLYIEKFGEYRSERELQAPVEGERRRRLYWLRCLTAMISDIMTRSRENPEFLAQVKAIPEILELLESEPAWPVIEEALLRVENPHDI